MRISRHAPVAAAALAALTIAPFASAHDEPLLPDIQVTVTAPTSLQLGETATFVVTVKNRGQADAHGLTLIDELPAGFNYVTAWSTLGTCWGSGSAVTCSLPGLPSFQRATVTIIVSAASVGVFTNEVRVVSSSPEFDAANNSAGSTVEIAAPAAAPAPVVAPPAPVAAAVPPVAVAPAVQQPAKPQPKKSPPKKKR